MKKMTEEELIEYYSKPQIPISIILGVMILGGLCWWAVIEIIKAILF
jgi:hypothetical protein